MRNCGTLLHMHHADALQALTRGWHFLVKWRHGCHLEIVASNWKSDSANWWVFTWRTILLNFILIRWSLGLFWRQSPTPTTTTTTTTTTRWVEIWDQFLVEKSQMCSYHSELNASKWDVWIPFPCQLYVPNVHSLYFRPRKSHLTAAPNIWTSQLQYLLYSICRSCCWTFRVSITTLWIIKRALLFYCNNFVYC